MLFVVTGRFHRDQGRLEFVRRGRRPASRLIDYTFSGSQLVSGKESGTTFPHREQGLAVHAAVELKSEKPGVALAEKALDSDVVANDLARSRQASMKRHDGIQQAVNSTTARLEIDSQVPGQEQVGLPGLNGDARRNLHVVEIPGSW